MREYDKNYKTQYGEDTQTDAEKPAQKIRKWLFKIAKIGFMCVALFGFVFALFVWHVLINDTECQHSWENATCERAVFCALCGETKGSPVGHTWKNATCTAAKHCEVCGSVLGTPLGHTAGDKDTHIDFETAELVEVINCIDCNKEIEKTTHAMDTFVEEDIFVFSPAEFLERMASIASDYYNDVTYRVTTVEGMLIGEFYYGDGLGATFTFYKPNMYPFQFNEIETKNVFCVAMELFAGEYTCEDLFLMTCDPTLDRENAVFLYNNAVDELIQSVSGGKNNIALFRNNMQFELHYLGEDKEGATNLMCIMSPDWQDVCDEQDDFSESVDISDNKEKTMATQWKDGSLNISFWNDAEYVIELVDENLNNYSGNDEQTLLTQILLIYGEEPYDGFGILLFHDGSSLVQESFYVEDISDMNKYKTIEVEFVEGNNIDGKLLIYGKLPDNDRWTLENLRGISIFTHVNENAQEHYIEVI